MPPQLFEHAELNPFLKVRVEGAARPELFGHRIPLATCSQHVENTSHYLSQAQPGTPTFATFFVNWEQGFDLFPERVRDLVKL
jgi:hypothetical protein